MPIQYAIDDARRLIRTTCTGFVTCEEVLGHFALLVQDVRCPDRLDVLLDLTGMTSVPETHELRDVAATIDGIRDRVQFGACAIVARDEMPAHIGRMFTTLAREQFRVTTVV